MSGTDGRSWALMGAHGRTLACTDQDSLKSAGETAVHSVTSMFLFVSAKVSNRPSEFYRSTDYAHDEPHFDPTVLPFARRVAMYTFVLLAPLPAGIKMP